MPPATADQAAQPPSRVRRRAARPHVHLGAGSVDVWRADLATVPEELTELLSHAERARAARSVREPRARLWARGRGVLRALLGHYLDVDPRSLVLGEGPHGKPALERKRTAGAVGRADRARGGLSFNLSHSGGIALYAFSTAGPVGIDVELGGRSRDIRAPAARAFGAGAAERLRRLDPATRELEFLRMWVHHEAALKCTGTGLGGATQAIVEGGLWIAELDVGPRAAAAVALEAPPRELRRWIWPPGTASPGGAGGGPARTAAARGS